MEDYVLITGPTGVGKSSVMDYLEKKFECKIFSDPYINNPFISEAYLNGSKAFQSQVYFFKEFLKIHKHITTECNNILVLQERSIYESVNVFCENLLIEDKINSDELALMHEMLSEVQEFIRVPDTIINLTASESVIVDRIKKRKRGFENNLSIDFVARQKYLYDQWLSNESSHMNNDIVQIDTDTLSVSQVSEKVIDILTT